MDKQKDFEKGWEEYKAKKKEAVEEIGQDIADICSDMALNCCGSTPCYACIAKRLERKGYRKIPENAVVLTGQDLELFCNIAGIISPSNGKPVGQAIVDKIRKETAEKFAERLKEHPIAKIYSLHNACERIPNAIDEICKEFTEGEK